MRKLVLASLCALVLSTACKRDQSSPQPASRTADAPLTVKRGLLVAGGLGSINGLVHTNSVEALRCNYRRGFRWFDVDVSVSADGELVSFHDGDEKVAGLPDRVGSLAMADLEKKKYADRFPIVRFSTLLAEADRLNDVVLILDAGEWPATMEHAVSRTLGYDSKHSTGIILQAYGENGLERVAPLGKELGMGLLLNLRYTEIDDAKVEELAKKYSVLGVVASTTRFTPWLAERLHAAQLPLLVHSVNEHRDIVNLMRAGADGFVTDRYVPYEKIAEDPTVAMECGEAKPSALELHSWTERNTSHPSDYRLPSCAKHNSTQIDLIDCDDQAMLRTTPLPVPSGQTLHVEVEVEAGNAPSSFWIEVAQKQKPQVLKSRELSTLQANEHKTFSYDVALAQGSLGAEARLGLASKKDKLLLHRLAVYHGERSVESPTVRATSDDRE